LRKNLFLALALLATAGAVFTSAPRAEASTCHWFCHCGGPVCSCSGFNACKTPPDIGCPQVFC
jgi:hypothetical protein